MKRLPLMVRRFTRFHLFFITLFASLFSYQAKASHVVGGDLVYRYLGNDSFEITLTLYIDCFNGNPLAIQEDTDAVIGIFGAADSLLKYSLDEFRTPPQRVSVVNYNCVSPPTNACVDKYVYTYHTRLPFLAGGYWLVFQRCCRNNSLTNIIDPASTGATYLTLISDTTWYGGHNDAAVFKTLPPNFLCANRDFVYDHSATDADGDSLSYGLYTPFSGASAGSPLPRPPNAPPYVPVLWSPGFSADSALHGNPEFSINPVTGLLRVKPTVVGQFVTGIYVNEYRNGKLIHTTRRDFQFNVLSCHFNVVSAFTQNITSCSDTVSFVNNSQGADSYLWDFGDTSVAGDTSSTFAPVYIYAHPGVYNAKLVVSKGNCADSIVAQVAVSIDTVRFAGPDKTICKGTSVQLGIADSGAFKYAWTPSAFLDDSLFPRPLATPPHTIYYFAQRTRGQCFNLDTVKITVDTLAAGFHAALTKDCRDVMLTVDSVAGGGSATWKINDDAVAFDKLTNWHFPFDSAVRVTLILHDSICADTATATYSMKSTDSVSFVPNVFTPNSDNLNDCFAPRDFVHDVDCSRLFIYNRWGQLLFDSRKDGACWNGTAGGLPVSDGVYYYILDQHGRQLHGTVTLLR